MDQGLPQTIAAFLEAQHAAGHSETADANSDASVFINDVYSSNGRRHDGNDAPLASRSLVGADQVSPLTAAEAATLPATAQAKLQLLECLINLSARSGQPSDAAAIASTSRERVVQTLSRELTAPAPLAPGAAAAGPAVAKAHGRLRQLTLKALHAYSGRPAGGKPAARDGGGAGSGALAPPAALAAIDYQLLEMARSKLMDCCAVRRPGACSRMFVVCLGWHWGGVAMPVCANAALAGHPAKRVSLVAVTRIGCWFHRLLHINPTARHTARHSY